MEESTEDTALMARIAAGDDRAMRVFFVRHHGRVLTFVRRLLRNDGMAEEVANEVFLEVWRGADSFQNRSAPLTWVFTIAHNRCVNILRKRYESSWNESEAAQIADAGDDPEVVAQKADKGQILRQCSDALPPMYREIIDLVYFHELSIKEVCEILDVPDGTVKTRLFQARKRLEQMLKEAGVDRGWP